MTLEELKNQLKSVGILPLCVSNPPPNGERGRLDFDGDLHAYIEALRAMGATLVVVYSVALEDADFIASDRDEDSGGADNEDRDERAVDLSEVNGDLCKFKAHVGRCGMFRLSTPFESEYLDLTVEEAWWLEFLDARTRATDEIQNARARSIAEEHSREEETVDVLISRVRSLAEDPKFGKLPTQKAMLLYALRQIPELEALEQTHLKAEIQNVKALIDAQRA